jgi:hypothetical protein
VLSRLFEARPSTRELGEWLPKKVTRREDRTLAPKPNGFRGGDSLVAKKKAAKKKGTKKKAAKKKK